MKQGGFVWISNKKGLLGLSDRFTMDSTNCKAFVLMLLCWLQQQVSGFKTGLEPGLICYQCVGTHPGCSLYDMDWRWYWGVICPRADDRCVKLIERRGSEVMVTRDCLSNLESFRVDIPADKYEGCRPASHDVKLAQYTFNTIKELDTTRDFYKNVTWCICSFDHWCNGSTSTSHNSALVFLTLAFVTIVSLL